MKFEYLVKTLEGTPNALTSELNEYCGRKGFEIFSIDVNPMSESQLVDNMIFATVVFKRELKEDTDIHLYYEKANN